ncbi:MAG: leucyl aminopeptidase family protein [Spirochaetota bacterium]
MAQKKGKSPRKEHNTARVFTYPAKLRCEITGKPNSKWHSVQFVTHDEVKKTTGLPAFFKGDAGETLTQATGFVVGLGALEKLDGETFADAVAAALVKAALKLEEYQILIDRAAYDKVGFRTALRLLVVAQSNAEYPSDFLKGEKNRKKVVVKKTEIVVPQSFTSVAEEILASALVEARHINAMRQTQALPGNYLTPQTMDDRAAAIAKQYKLTRKSFGKAELTRMGAGGILAVSQGSDREPRLIILEYRHAQAKKTLGLVGKGVTFDTGGISLKPGADMHEMKYDMSGSAMALHALAAIAEQKIPVNVVCAIAMVENMPSGNAFKPGDVYTALNGKTIEVQNTDAEGRLILADALTYVQKHYKADLLIDMATLTGACVVALGDFYAGLFSNNSAARAMVEKAAAESREPVWALPIGPRYRELLNSDIADLNNIGGRYGGACTAAEFLNAFVDEGQMWVHLDIAGVGMIKKPFSVYTASGSGYGVRLLAEVARQMAGGV